MDFELDQQQQAIIDAVSSLLERSAGAARAIELAANGEYDTKLHDELASAGFTELAITEGGSALEAVLATEAVARSAGRVAFGQAALVVPGLLGRTLAGPTALVLADDKGPVRFAVEATSFLIVDGNEARLIECEAGAVPRTPSNFGYPMGTPSEELRRGGQGLGPGSGEKLRAWWRIMLAAEAVGAMSAAMDVTTDYLKNRRQFGRTIASFQAVQHRLAECKVLLEGARWLVYEAAALDAPAEQAALAAAHALSTAGRVFVETHQLSGAIGFTHEHDLHVWSMRLQALRLELGGTASHRRAVSLTRWMAEA